MQLKRRFALLRVTISVFQMMIITVSFTAVNDHQLPHRHRLQVWGRSFHTDQPICGGHKHRPSSALPLCPFSAAGVARLALAFYSVVRQPEKCKLFNQFYLILVELYLTLFCHFSGRIRIDELYLNFPSLFCRGSLKCSLNSIPQFFPPN